MKLAIIIAGNLFFYLCAGSRSQLIILLFTACIVYITSRIIDKIYLDADGKKPESLSITQELEFLVPYKKKSKIVLIAGLAIILFIFMYVKIGRFLHWEVAGGLSVFEFKKILVPLGLSYYTFSSVGYLIDIYKRRIRCTHNFFIFFSCISFFPIIVEGPINRYERLIGQFEDIPQFEYSRFCKGMQLVLWGFFKKLVIADRISPFTTSVFGDIMNRGGSEIIITAFFGMFAAYTDFSGCMDIVTGVAESMGITIDKNFEQPFYSHNVAEFWRRWHMSLMSWFRDYIYMPISRSKWLRRLGRKSKHRFGKHFGDMVMSTIPMITVWLVTGLWHATGKNYIAWAMYWAMLTFLSKFFEPTLKRINTIFQFRTETFGWNFFRVIRTDVLYAFSLIITRIVGTSGFRAVGTFVTRNHISNFKPWLIFNGTIFSYGMDQRDFIIAIIGIIFVMFVDGMNYKGVSLRNSIAIQPIFFRWLIWIAIIIMVLIWGCYGPDFNAADFIYMGF